MTIQTIVAALVALVSSWKTPNNLDNDIADALLALSTAQGVSPSAFGSAALKFVQRTEAGIQNVESGQAATLATFSEGGADYSVVVVKNGGAAAQTLGL